MSIRRISTNSKHSLSFTQSPSCTYPILRIFESRRRKEKNLTSHPSNDLDHSTDSLTHNTCTAITDQILSPHRSIYIYISSKRSHDFMPNPQKVHQSPSTRSRFHVNPRSAPRPLSRGYNRALRLFPSSKRRRTARKKKPPYSFLLHSSSHSSPRRSFVAAARSSRRLSFFIPSPVSLARSLSLTRAHGSLTTRRESIRDQPLRHNERGGDLEFDGP